MKINLKILNAIVIHKSKFKISKQQAQILHHQSNESNLLNIIESPKITISNLYVEMILKKFAIK